MKGNETHPLTHGNALGMCVFVAILTFAGALHAVEQGVTGKKLLLKGTTKLVLLSKDASVSIAGSDPTTGGGDSSISFALDNGAPVTFALPEGAWTKNGTDTVFKYKNSAAPAGPSPVKVAKVQPGVIKIVAKGVPFAVPKGAATVHAVLSLDGGSNVYCMTFDGSGDGSKFLVLNATAGSCPSAAPTSTPTIPSANTPTHTPTQTASSTPTDTFVPPTSTPINTATATPSATPTPSSTAPICIVDFRVSPVSYTSDPTIVPLTSTLTVSGCDPSLKYTFFWWCTSSDTGNCDPFEASESVREESPGQIIERRWLDTIPLTTYVVNVWAEGALPDGTVVLATTILTSNIDITEVVSF